MNPNILAIARSIVNQLADVWEVRVGIRQVMNDQCDEFAVKLLNGLINVMAENRAVPDLLEQAMKVLTTDGKPIEHIQCDKCGYVEDYHLTDVTAEELQKDGKETIMRLKENYAENGWKTSWGFDLCPEYAKREE